MYRGIKWTLLLVAVMMVALAMAAVPRASEELYLGDDSDGMEIIQRDPPPPPPEAEGIEKIQFRVYPWEDWEDIEDVLYYFAPAPEGPFELNLDLRAVPYPAGSVWPQDEPEWGELGVGQTGEISTVTFEDTSAHDQDYQQITCSFENDTLTVNVIVFYLGIDGADSMVGLNDTIEITAELTPNIQQAQYLWIVDEDYFEIDGPDNQQSVNLLAVDAGADITCAISVSPPGQMVLDWMPFPFWLSVIRLEGLKYRVGPYWWQFDPVPDPMYVAKGSTIEFFAETYPGGWVFSEMITWSDEAAGNPPGEFATVLFDDVSIDINDIKHVTASMNENHYITANIIVCEVEKLLYRLDEEAEYVEVPEPIYVAKGTEVEFKAIPKPDGINFPEGQPVWGGAATGQAPGDVAKVTFNAVSTTGNDYKIVTAHWEEHFVEAKIIVLDADVTINTSWLVIEDKDGPGAGVNDPQNKGPSQSAANIAKISYNINPEEDVDTLLPAITNVILILHNVNHSYQFELDIEEYPNADIETLNGKLRIHEGDWVPGGEAFFQAGVYQINLLVEINEGEFELLFEHEEEIVIKPLMTGLTFTPDIAQGAPLCPYSYVIEIEDQIGFGLSIDYELQKDLGSLSVEIHGAAFNNGKITLWIDDETRHMEKDAEYEGPRGKWEGFDFSHPFGQIHYFPTTRNHSPLSVVAEGDDYLLVMEMTIPGETIQEQKYEIPITVGYRYDMAYEYP